MRSSHSLSWFDSKIWIDVIYVAKKQSFSSLSFSCSAQQNNDVMEKCLALFQLDYNTVEINNRAGELSSHYPSLIVIPENEKQQQKPNGLSSMSATQCPMAAATAAAAATAVNNGSLTPPPSAFMSSTSSSSSSSSSSAANAPASAPIFTSFGLTNITVASNPSAGRTQQQTIYENSYDSAKLRDLMNKARFARSRTRFPVPVILYKGKFVCRSSTLSCGPGNYWLGVR